MRNVIGIVCLSEWVSVKSRAWITKLMWSLFSFNNWCPFAIILFAAYLLPFPFLNFLIKREILENLRDNLIGKPIGEGGRIWAEKQPLESKCP